MNDASICNSRKIGIQSRSNKAGNEGTNEKLRRIRAAIDAVEKQKYYIFGVCVCSLSYSTWKAHAPYSHQWLVPLYNIFPHNLTNGKIVGKKIIEHKKCGLIFSTYLV
jgi:hypothetical protein